MDFQVGDTVKLIDKDCIGYYLFSKAVGTVKETYKNGTVKVKFKNCKYSEHEQYLREEQLSITKDNKGNVMKKVTKGILGAVAGAALGAATAPVAVVTNMVSDLTAPVSYPLYGVVVGVMGSLSHEEKILKTTCVVASTVSSICAIPFAPINFCHRPFTTPVFNTIAGAIVGGVVASKIKAYG